MDPFVYRLQELTYRERYPVISLASQVQVTRQTLSGWINQRWKIPLDGARKLVVACDDTALQRAFLSGTGLRVLPTHPHEVTRDHLFYLVGQHMASYSRLVELMGKVKQRTATIQEREEIRRILNEFRDLTDALEAVLNEDESSVPPMEPVKEH